MCESASADTMLLNGCIHTVHDVAAAAEALAIAEGRIVALGATSIDPANRH